MIPVQTWFLLGWLLGWLISSLFGRAEHSQTSTLNITKKENYVQKNLALRIRFLPRLLFAAQSQPTCLFWINKRKTMACLL